NVLQGIGYSECNRCPLAAHDGAFFDESTKPDAFAGLDALLQNIARDVKEDDTVFQCKHNEDQRQAERRDAAADQNSSFLLSCHRVSPPSILASEPELTCQILDAGETALIVFQSSPCIIQGFDCVVPAAEDGIGANELQPAGCIRSIRLQTRSEPIDHTPDEGLAFLRAHCTDGRGAGSR